MWSNLCQENSGVCLVSGSHSFANSNMMGEEAANILCFLNFLVYNTLPSQATFALTM